MTLTEAQVTTALEAVRTLVRADGGDIVVAGVSDNSATLDLVLEGAECRECVMPRQFLEQVALDMMQASVPSLRTVTINDPRESA